MSLGNHVKIVNDQNRIRELTGRCNLIFGKGFDSKKPIINEDGYIMGIDNKLNRVYIKLADKRVIGFHFNDANLNLKEI